MNNSDYSEFGMNNFNKFAEFTETSNWQGICRLNDIDLDSFGTKKELAVLPKYLEPDEVVLGLTSGIMKQTSTSNNTDWGANTWLVVLTHRRFLFLDHAMLTSSVDTQSVRLDKVQAVSGSLGFIFGKIQIDLGARVIVIDNCTKSTVTAMANMANKWMTVLQRKNEAAASAPAQNVIVKSPLEELKILADLKAAGVLDDDEFNSAKAKLLAKL